MRIHIFVVYTLARAKLSTPGLDYGISGLFIAVATRFRDRSAISAPRSIPSKRSVRHRRDGIVEHSARFFDGEIFQARVDPSLTIRASRDFRRFPNSIRLSMNESYSPVLDCAQTQPKKKKLHSVYLVITQRVRYKDFVQFATFWDCFLRLKAGAVHMGIIEVPGRWVKQQTLGINCAGTDVSPCVDCRISRIN